MEPKYFKYMNKNVYELDDLRSIVFSWVPKIQTCIEYKSIIQTKKQISEEHYFYAKNKNDCWIESTSKQTCLNLSKNTQHLQSPQHHVL